jgi:hypothetical protein
MQPPPIDQLSPGPAETPSETWASDDVGDQAGDPLRLNQSRAL